jgi:hypothetical protein
LMVVSKSSALMLIVAMEVSPSLLAYHGA